MICLDWNVYEKRINTKVGPDSMKTVCRNTKTGKIMEYTSTFTDRGVTFNSKSGGAESTEVYKYFYSTNMVLLE